jgi:hypothetical protein
MATVLVTAIRENCGYLQDEGWHQTAHLMTLAAHEIERLNDRVRELETRAPVRGESRAQRWWHRARPLVAG